MMKYEKVNNNFIPKDGKANDKKLTLEALEDEKQNLIQEKQSLEYIIENYKEEINNLKYNYENIQKEMECLKLSTLPPNDKYQEFGMIKKDSLNNNTLSSETTILKDNIAKLNKINLQLKGEIDSYKQHTQVLYFLLLILILL